MLLRFVLGIFYWLIMCGIPFYKGFKFRSTILKTILARILIYEIDEIDEISWLQRKLNDNLHRFRTSPDTAT